MNERDDYYRLRNVLNNIEGVSDIHISEEELEDIANSARIDISHTANVGVFKERVKHNEREKAFHLNWLHENRPVPFVNNGNGTLSDLFSEYSKKHKLNPFIEISDRERTIVATAIQWLGSNVGWGFLENTLKDCGFKIIEAKKMEELYSDSRKLRKLMVLTKELKENNLE